MQSIIRRIQERREALAALEALAAEQLEAIRRGYPEHVPAALYVAVVGERVAA